MGGTFSYAVDNDDLINILKLKGFVCSKDVERVFRAVDRGDYIPEAQRDRAYKDMSCKVGNIHLSAPCVYSKVMEGLCLEPGLSFLNIGSGTGYLSTMAGLILGENGTNHGVELHEDCLEYAKQHLEEFKKNSLNMDVFEFCEPVFYQGNFLNVIPNRQYDRVYCGAACPPGFQTFLKRFVKIGGILVMPCMDLLLKIRRVSANRWTKTTLLPVSFASLVVPQSEEQSLMQLPSCNPYTLQELCRNLIRSQLRKNVWSEHKDLEAKEPIKTVRSECSTPQRSTRATQFMDIQNQAHRGRASPTIWYFAMDITMSLDTFIERIECSGEGQNPAETSSESESSDDSGCLPPIQIIHYNKSQEADTLETIEAQTVDRDEKMEMDNDENDNEDLHTVAKKDFEETKDSEDVEMKCEKMENGEQSGSQKPEVNKQNKRHKSAARGSNDSSDDSDFDLNPRCSRDESCDDLSKNLSNMSDDMDDDDDGIDLEMILLQKVYSMCRANTEMDRSSVTFISETSDDFSSSSSSTSSSSDACVASVVKPEVSSTKATPEKSKTTRENETTRNCDIDVLASEWGPDDSPKKSKTTREKETTRNCVIDASASDWEQDESPPPRKRDYCVKRGNDESGSKKRVVAKSKNAKNDGTLDRSNGKKTETTVDNDSAKDLDSSSDDDDESMNQRELRFGQRRSSRRKFFKFDDAGTSTLDNATTFDTSSESSLSSDSETSGVKRNFTNRSSDNKETSFCYKIRNDLVSTFMKTKINELPLPPPLRLYLNYNREL